MVNDSFCSLVNGSLHGHEWKAAGCHLGLPILRGLISQMCELQGISKMVQSIYLPYKFNTKE